MPADRSLQLMRNPVPLHVDQLTAVGQAGVEAGLGDARALDLPDDSVDAVLLFGPLYHLVDRADRLADPVDREVVLGSARAIERVPELLGLSPHMLLVARVPAR